MDHKRDTLVAAYSAANAISFDAGHADPSLLAIRNAAKAALRAYDAAQEAAFRVAR